MIEFVKKIREFMKQNGLNYLLVNSTNKYLEEYTPLEENSRYFLTDFSGSTGGALVTDSDIYLFVDGRYHIQADLEVDKNIVTVVKLQTGQLFLDELSKMIPSGEKLGIFSKKISQKNVEYIQNKGVCLEFFDKDPLDKIIESDSSNFEKVDGVPVEKKVEQIDFDGAVLITNLEEVSYLFNLRDFSKNYSSKIRGKAVILSGRARLLEEINDFVESYCGNIYVDKATVSAYDFSLLKDKARILNDSPIKLMKSVKSEDEIAHYIQAFKNTDNAVRAIRKFIELIEQDKPIPVYGDGTTMRDYTYIDDIVNGIMSAINYDKTPYEIINLGGGSPVTLNEMIATIEKVLGKKAKIERLPMQPGDVDRTVADITKARRLLNYNPQTTFEEGIRKFIEWRNNG